MISKIAINGSDLLFRRWSIDNPKGQILIVHGLAEHSGRYKETAEQLNSIGYNVVAFDRKGEGASEGKKAYIHNFDDQVKDVADIVHSHLQKDLNTFIFGHSLGGLIVTKYIIDYQPDHVAGVILSGPLLKVDDDISPFLKKVSGFVGRVLPWLPTVKVDHKLVSKDPNVQKAYLEDPFIFHGATKARTGFQILKTTNEIQDKLEHFKHPVLIMHGGADKLSDPKGSQRLYDECNSTVKRIEIFEGLFHEIMHEPEKELFYKTMKNWLMSLE